VLLDRLLPPLRLVLALVVAWWILAPPGQGGWWAGVVAVVAGFGAHRALGGSSVAEARLRPLRLPAFLPWFLFQSMKGGADVARRALAPSLPLEPGFLGYPLRIPEGPARVFFLNAISLLPGTFSARLEGAELRVHVLAEPDLAPDRLARLEARVARLFGLELEEGSRRDAT
jgi:multicomponent Na+:H+ antiporter subunit E